MQIPYQICDCKYFSQSLDYLFIFVMVLFEVQKFLILMKVNFLFFVSCGLGVRFKIFPNSQSQRFTPMLFFFLFFFF